MYIICFGEIHGVSIAVMGSKGRRVISGEIKYGYSRM